MNKLTIDELEMLNPEELGELLLSEVNTDSPDVQFIQDLLYVGCPIDARDKDSRTSLILAVRSRKSEVGHLLVFRGADVNVMDKYNVTALHWACTNGDLGLVKLLVQNEAGVDLKQISFNWTGLTYASAAGHFEVVKFLISKGADVHGGGEYTKTPLHMAANNGHLEVVKYLLSNGADIHTRDDDGYRAWDLSSTEIKEVVPELEPK